MHRVVRKSIDENLMELHVIFILFDVFSVYSKSVMSIHYLIVGKIR